MARPWARTSRADFTWAMVVGWMEHKARLGWPMIWYSHSSTIHLYIIPGSFKKSSHGTWQASNLRSPLQPPLQSCNWKGLNVPNLNGCFFWRPTATTRKKQLWSWGPRGIPRLNLVFYRMAVFYEEPGMVAFSQKSCSNQATHWATEASLSRSEIPSGRWRQPWSKSLREQLRGIDDLRETGNEAPCLELKNKTAPVYCWVCVCILSTWFHAQNTTRSVNADPNKNIRLQIPPAIKTRPSPPVRLISLCSLRNQCRSWISFLSKSSQFRESLESRRSAL